MTILELMQRRNQALTAARNFAESHRTDKGILSDEDSATYDQMEKEIMDMSREISRMQRQEAMEQELSQPVNSPITGRPYQASAEPEKKTGRASDEYRKGMLQALRTNFRQISNVLQEGIDENGGYLVPEEYDHRLIDVLNEENIMRRLGTTITTSGQHKINIAATKPAAAWIEEGGALTFGDATFDQIMLDAYKLHVAIKVTEELLYDNAFHLENYIIDQFGKALANAEEDAFLNGDGTGKPLGIFAPKNAKFILNDQTIASLRKLKDLNGQYMWQPALISGEPDRLLGYEVLTSPFAPVAEAGKPFIAFGDFKYYNIGDRGTRSFQELKELFAGNGMVGYVAKERVDGKLILPEAVQLLTLKGTASSGS